jgi:hypothetical protein
MKPGGASLSPDLFRKMATDLDRALLRAWDLFEEDVTDEVENELRELLPMLVDAGYVTADEYKWAFTAKGVSRAKALLNSP